MDERQNKFTVIISGADKVGIVAKVTNVLAGQRVNIENIKQTLLQGHFVMFLLVDITNSNSSFNQIEKSLFSVGREFDVDVRIQEKQNSDNISVF